MSSKLADLFTKYNCTNCQEEITSIRVHCAVCENFDLCLQCFAAGAEIGPHQNNHDYQFMDSGTTILSVFRGKNAWTAREEIRLLDAIEQYGYGNWEDISKHIETKSAEDAKEEYVNKFVTGTIGRHTWLPAQTQRPSLVEHTSEDEGPLGNAALQRLPPLDISAEEATQLGYMPNRDSFEREYDPTAEQLISSLSLNVDDTEADYLLKLAHVDMYTRRLRERVRRKRLVRDYQLAANFFRNRQASQVAKHTREQRDFRDRFRVFAQFYTCNEYERLLNSLDREKDLRIRLSELCRYRYNGLTRFEECRHFEQHAAMANHRATGPYGHGKTDQLAQITGNPQLQDYSLHSPHRNQIKAELSSDDEVSLSSIAKNSMRRIGDPIYSGASLPNKNYLDSCQTLPAPMMKNQVTANTQAIAMTTTTPTLTSTSTTLIATNMKVIPPHHHQQQQQQHVQTVKQEYQKLQQQQQQQQQKQIINQSQPPPLLQLHPLTTKQQLQLEKHGNNVNAISNLNHNNKNNSSSSSSSSIKNYTHSIKARQISQILQAQLDELKRLPEPLGAEILSKNERSLCMKYNMSPTTYLSLKTLLLNNPPLSSSSLSPVEKSVRKYLIQVGWLHG